MNSSWIIVLFLQYLIQKTLCSHAYYEAEETLNAILNNKTLYSADIRPRDKDGNGATHVAVNLMIRNIEHIDDINMEFRIQVTVRQEWKDNRLMFNHTDFITLPEDITKIWTPDLFFINEKEAKTHNAMKPNVMIRVAPDGVILLSVRLSLVLSCPMNLKFYPLDKQRCIIRIGSYSWTVKDLEFTWKAERPIQLPSPLHLQRFTLDNHTTTYCNHTTTTGQYSCLLAKFTFQRELGYYMIQNFLPCGMIVMVSWISFWLGASTIDARVSLGFTTMLTMVAQIYGINQAVPPVSYTKALDVWTGTCLVFIILAIVEVSIVGYNIQLYKYRQTLPLPFMNNVKNQNQNQNQQRPTLGGGLLQRSNKVDYISRILFPVSFLIFNIVYWYAYMFSESGERGGAVTYT